LFAIYSKLLDKRPQKTDIVLYGRQVSNTCLRLNGGSHLVNLRDADHRIINIQASVRVFGEWQAELIFTRIKK